MMMMVMVTSVLPEEADLAKSSKELWVAKVVGVVEDNRGHLYRKSECNAWRKKIGHQNGQQGILRDLNLRRCVPVDNLV